MPRRGRDRYNLTMADRRDPPSTTTSEAASGRAIDDLAMLDRFAAELAGPARVGDVFALSGELGAGKTALARSFISALARREGVEAPEDVPSPTFTLMQEYDIGALRVFHFDLYRLKNADEALELGVEDACSEGVALIEWPDRLGPWLPRDRVDVRLAIVGEGRRRAEVVARGRAAERYGALQ
ncbi:MAG: tRNA (adenosine(37)-N6)-threonylcarbamoyltransferase complex ATPase subunit type 1 TsaE [Gemmatimonas sp.]